ncbi:ExbD/TolR family protein [Hymenobacter radiodurans]|uniref:ExbD/TolR family protein n=1 Tax=Hymenobacter radiodurans TaxID=2496028 RepID=UPI00105841F3|nr:biopolymer transporter ExbD [Hymenobacter radiodurans]
MTPMVDLAFLLVTFFMLTTKFAPEEVVMVDTPSSTSDLKLPDTNLITLSVDKDGKTYFALDSEPAKILMLEKVGAKYGISFTPQQKKRFGQMTSFGVPIQQLGSLLDRSKEEIKTIKQPGIPTDSTNNQIIDWVIQGRAANQQLFKKPVYIAIKGDNNADVPTVRKLIKYMQDKDINRFNLITDLEMKPKLVSN